ncbi:hypothetical protein ABZS88_46125, partial [Streptomyces sp. NPDC005480]|uniref:hypothetical protein n=1 Tax=Streptomyces sp. NPDC005480 TaxID=3154880 RepID=UPI0033BAFB25
MVSAASAAELMPSLPTPELDLGLDLDRAAGLIQRSVESGGTARRTALSHIRWWSVSSMPTNLHRSRRA